MPRVMLLLPFLACVFISLPAIVTASEASTASEVESSSADKEHPTITTIDPPEAGFFSKTLVYEGLQIKSSETDENAAPRKPHQ